MPPSIVPAGDSELRLPALTFLYHLLPRGERERQLADTLDSVARGEVSLEHLLVAVEEDRIAGAILAVRRPGGAAFLWPPVVAAGPAGVRIGQALVEAVGRRMDEQQVVFTQSLLDPADTLGQAVLAGGGLPYLTELIVLSRALGASRSGRRASGRSGKTGVPAEPDRDPAALFADSGLTPECYSPDRHAEFVRVIERTYVDTLDCPALAQVRTGEQLLEAQQAGAIFQPDGCCLYRAGDQPIGVLLLTDHPERSVREVTYLGVVPEARHRGWGRAILAHGLDRAARAGHVALELAVDSQNTPACGLYASLEFRELRRFAVHLRLRGAAT